MHRHLLVAVAAALSLLSVPAGAPMLHAQQSQESALLELAERLINSPGSSVPGGQDLPALTLLPGAVPADAVLVPPVAPGGRLVGSSLQRSPDQDLLRIVLDYPGTTSQALGFYTDALAATGWTQQQRGSSLGGFMATPASSSVFFCSTTSREMYAMMNAGPIRPGVADVRISVYRGGALMDLPVDLCDSSSSSSQTRLLNAALPPLRPPSGARVVTTGFTVGSRLTGSSAILESPLSPGELLGALDGQLADAGWVRTDGGDAGPVAWSTWNVTDEDGSTAVLQVVAVPGEARQAATLQLFTPGAFSPGPSSTTVVDFLAP